MLVASVRPGAAQDPNLPADPVRFNTEVVVTPERAETPRALEPFATDMISAPALTFPAVTFGDAASFIPGFVVAGGEPHGRPPVISARGFFGGGEADYVLLLVDGVPVSDAESGLIDWSALTTASIRSVEAARGPGASTYGDSSVGGVIQRPLPITTVAYGNTRIATSSPAVRHQR